MQKNEYKRMASIEASHWWYKALHALLLQNLNKLKLSKQVYVLDAGCGTGRFSQLLKAQYQVTSFDYSSQALRYASKHNLNLIQASLNQIPFKNKSFSAAFCISVLDQQSIDDNQALTQIFRVLNPKGYLVLVVPAYNWLFSHHDKAIYARKRYQFFEIRRLLKQNNFKIIKSQYIFSFLFPIFLFKRLLEKLTPPTKAVSDLTMPHKIINKLLYLICLIEWQLTRFFPLPFGSSMLVIARKS